MSIDVRVSVSRRSDGRSEGAALGGHNDEPPRRPPLSPQHACGNLMLPAWTGVHDCMGVLVQRVGIIGGHRPNASMSICP